LTNAAWPAPSQHLSDEDRFRLDTEILERFFPNDRKILHRDRLFCACCRIWKDWTYQLPIYLAADVGAGIVDDPDGRGIALRFPRFKGLRPDASIEQATTTEEVAHLFYEQIRSRTSSDVYIAHMPYFGCDSFRASMSTCNDTVFSMYLQF
jgi:hypothetical protein